MGNKNCKKLNKEKIKRVFWGLGTSYIDVKRSEKSKKVNFVIVLLFSFKFLCIFLVSEKTYFFV
jgi:hypothetical protein